jgi:hypothetical protein
MIKPSRVQAEKQQQYPKKTQHLYLYPHQSHFRKYLLLSVKDP